MPTKLATSWRDVLPIHPAAEFFPLMSPDERRELGEDIKKHGGLPAMPLVLWEAEKDAPQFLLDGRNRLDAMEAVGLPVLDKEGKWLAWNLSCQSTRARGGDPVAYVISANIHRRHLTAEDKRELIGKLLKADPSKSDRQIGGLIKADHKTVGAVRAHGEATGEISPVERRVGADGKSRKWPSGKSRKAKPAKAVAPAPQPSTEAPQPAAEQPHGLMGRPEPSPRDDVGPDSAAEAVRLRVYVEKLEAEKRCLELEQRSRRFKLATTGIEGWENYFQSLIMQERDYFTDLLTEVVARIHRDILDEAKAAIETALARRIRGTHNPQSEYSANDMVALDGGSFIARKDNPGPCPGAGWQLMARQGSRGIAGPEGKRGPPGNIITGWILDRSNFRVTPRLSDGTLGPPLELRALFEQDEDNATA
jgi:hypothetical protein